ncbi:MAG: tetratricopeptide repeat protein [Phycisphaerae bacterium]
MMQRNRVFSTRVSVMSATAILCLSTIGCGPNFRQLRKQGQRALTEQNYAVARDCFERAYRKQPGDAENLFDMGTVHLIRGKERVADGNQPAALRELDRAIWYFSGAIESHPGMQAALVGKNQALELKGRYDQALDEAVWATAFVGPRAREQVYLARELEERGDYDAALLRYRQAVAMERDNAMAHAALGQFLHRRGNREMALVHLKTAYKLNPLEPDVAGLLTNLGQPLPRTTRRLETRN